MIRPRIVPTFLIFVLALLAASRAPAQNTTRVTPEWLYGDGAHIADVPRAFWLADSTAILRGTPLPER